MKKIEFYFLKKRVFISKKTNTNNNNNKDKKKKVKTEGFFLKRMSESDTFWDHYQTESGENSPSPPKLDSQSHEQSQTPELEMKDTEMKDLDELPLSLNGLNRKLTQEELSKQT